jgi:hypothetical protein
MPASTNGTKIFCIYCGFAKDTYSPPEVPLVPVDDSWKKKLHWKQVENPGGGYTFYLENDVLPNSVQVFRNGVLLSKNNDYYESGGCINMSSCTSNGDRITVQYVKEGY